MSCHKNFDLCLNWERGGPYKTLFYMGINVANFGCNTYHALSPFLPRKDISHDGST